MCTQQWESAKSGVSSAESCTKGTAAAATEKNGKREQ
jgi:hypothetical protein